MDLPAVRVFSPDVIEFQLPADILKNGHSRARPRSSALRRPTSSQSATTHSASDTHLRRPRSGVRDSHVRQSTRPRSAASIVGRPLSAAAGGKFQAARRGASGHAKLPALPKNPLSFDDLYAIAKRRAAALMQQHRQAMKEELELLEQKSLYPWRFPRDEATEEQAWASEALAGAADGGDSTSATQESDDDAGFSDAGGTEAGVRRSSKSSKGSKDSVPAPRRSSVELQKFLKLCKGTEKGFRRNSLTQHRSKNRQTRTEAIRLAEAHIAKMSQMMEGESWRGSGRASVVQSGHHDKGSDFTDAEMSCMHIAYSEHAIDGEVHKDDLSKALLFLGYLKVDFDTCVELANELAEYATLGFDEFVDFVDTFAAYEREQFYKEFNEFDTDSTGTLDTNELRNFLEKLGITPLREVLHEAVAIVDFDRSGDLDFEEFIHLVALYRVTKGFTEKELVNLKEVFERLAQPVAGGGKEIIPEKLHAAILYIFGPQSMDLAQKIILDKRCQGARPEDHPGLTFIEFVVWARFLREAEVQEYRKQFYAADWDASGYLNAEEVTQVIANMGYMPLRALINEMLDEVDGDTDQKLDFEEFVNLLTVFRRTDGFCAAELAELSSVFHRFEKPGTGVLDCLELEDALRFIGYATDLDKARRLIKSVDFDNSNTLGLPQFFRLMRIHREDELRHAMSIFTSFLDGDGTNEIRVPKLKQTLEALGHTPDGKALEAMLTELQGKSTGLLLRLDFDAFIQIVDSCRKAMVRCNHRHADFSEEEVAKYRLAFDGYDENGNGEIEKTELSELLKDLDFPMNTKKHQAEMLGKMDAAREKAALAGIEKAAVGCQGEASLKFHPFLFMLRLVQKEADNAEVDHDAELIKQTNFSQTEIDDFRDIFCFWAEKVALDEKVAKLREDLHFDLSTKGATIRAATTDENNSRNQYLSLDGMLRVVRSLGLQTNFDERKVLHDTISNLPRAHAKRFELSEFLALMRWMLDRNFAFINTALSKQPQSKPEGVEPVVKVEDQPRASTVG